MDAVESLPNEIAAKIMLLFIGEIYPPEKSEILKRITQTNHLTSAQIVVHDEFIKEEEIDPLMHKADVILLTYPQHYDSSGVLVRAAAAETPVLASDSGYLGAVVAEKRLGFAVDASNPKAIAHSIQKIVALEDSTDWYSKAQMRIFAEKNTYYYFVKTITDNLK